MAENTKTKEQTKKKRRVRTIAPNSRAAFNREMRQEDMRERVRNSNLLTDIYADITSYTTLCKAAKDLQTKSKPDRDKTNVELRKINTQADIIERKQRTRFRLLKKVLPDLTAVQLTDEEGNDLLKAFLNAATNGPNKPASN